MTKQRKLNKDQSNDNWYKRPILYPDAETESNVFNVNGFHSMMTFYLENDRFLNMDYKRMCHFFDLARVKLPDSKQDEIEDAIDKIREKYRNGLYPEQQLP